MAVNFLDPESTTVVNGILNRTTSSATPGRVVESSKDVSGIEIRMLPPYIKDNHTSPALFHLIPGFSKLYCITIVVSDVASQLAGNIDLKGFPRIGDNEYLPINKTVFYWQSQNDTDKAPNQVHVFCSVLKSKKGLRDTGKILSDIKNDQDYTSLVGSLGKIAKDVTKFNVVTDILVQLASVVGKYLGNVEDKPIGTVINSYTTLHGDFDNAGITPLVYTTPDTDFHFEVVVRNKVVEQEIARDFNGTRAGAKSKRSRSRTTEAEEVEVDMQPL